MHELFIQALRSDEVGDETPALTRERLKPAFPPGATRRMTQLGMIVGAVLGPLAPAEDDAVVYLSRFGESRSLEAYLDSFPCASPMQFQTSIHPSGVQQLLIGRQIAIGEFFPLSGDGPLVTQGLLTAALSGSARILLCGGEEKGTWLEEKAVASSDAFAFAMALTRERVASTLGRIALDRGSIAAGLPLLDWFRLLHSRTPFQGPAGPYWNLTLEWF